MVHEHGGGEKTSAVVWKIAEESLIPSYMTKMEGQSLINLKCGFKCVFVHIKYIKIYLRVTGIFLGRERQWG